MDKLKNLKENIFGENNKHASDSIDFSVKPQQAQKNKLQLNQNQKEIKEKNVIKPLSDVGTNNIKKEKAKSDSDPLSYSTYNKNTLKNISDPLTQMKPNSTFGYPTKKKETNIKENKEKENKDKEKNIMRNKQLKKILMKLMRMKKKNKKINQVIIMIEEEIKQKKMYFVHVM